jgi:hypothetical protein
MAAVQIQRWADGWPLVGNGPSYLLFTPNKEVMHLTSGLTRVLRRDLLGYQAIDLRQARDELAPLAQALVLASAQAVYDRDTHMNSLMRKAAVFTVIQEIEQLIRLFPQPQIFEGRLHRLTTLIRAAGILAMHDAPGAPGEVLRCEPNSRIARCAQALWLGGDPTKPYRVPTRAELGQHLCLDKPALSKLVRAEGFDWLPRARAGRPPMSARAGPSPARAARPSPA